MQLHVHAALGSMHSLICFACLISLDVTVAAGPFDLHDFDLAKRSLLHAYAQQANVFTSKHIFHSRQ